MKEWADITATVQRIESGGAGSLPDQIQNLEGYSGWKVRELLNFLCSDTGTIYLEIGVHTGSTFIPAMYKNKVTGTAIDNWSLMGNFRPQFEKNLRKYLPRRKFNILEEDFRTVDLAKMHSSVNVYFYDGDHGRDCHYQAFYRLKPIFADRFIAVVDDFNWVEPRDETYRSIKDAGMTIENSVVLPGPYNGSKDAWWNGLFVGIIRKG